MAPPRPAWADYAPASAVDHCAWWLAEHCEQSVDKHAGLPLVLEPWQLDIMGEALAVNDDGSPYWSTVTIVLPRKNGKALALDTPIPTPDGWTTMGELSEGDIVFDDQGKRCRVTFATDVMHNHDCYRVTFSDGTSVVADADHLWEARDRHRARTVVETTRVMAERVNIGNSGKVERRYSIPVAGAIDCDEVDLPVDPYVLGVWLGDGATASGCVTTADDEIREELEAAGFPTGSVQTQDGNRSTTATALGLRQRLRVAGALGNKHIPAAYLRASRLQRLHLLQGLMDTDGSAVGGTGSGAEFYSTSPRLAADVLELARSLGFKPVMRSKRATLNGKDCGTCWRILFTAYRDDCVFRLRRKWETLRDRPERETRASRRQITAIEPVDSVPVRCIQVDSPSHLFLCGDGMVPTHNTTLLAAYASYHADTWDGAPEVLLTASSDKQAGRLFDSVVSFARRSDYLTSRFHLREYIGEMARTDGGGKIMRMASDPGRLHGFNPSLVIVDELHAWTKPGLKKAWAALVSGGGARDNTQTFVISTAGEASDRSEGILGQLIDGNEAAGDVERRHPGLTISRNHEARVLVFNYSAPVQGATPKEMRRDLPAIRLANPASWISDDYLRRQSESPEMSDAEFLQLHGGVWAAGADTFISPDDWRALGDGRGVPPASVVALGMDGSRTYDTTVVAWAGVAPDGRVDVDCRIFSVRREAPHHEFHEGGRIDFQRVEDFILDRFAAFTVTEAAYDPRYLDRTAELVDARLPEAAIIAVEPQSRHLRDALASLYRAVSDGTLRHTGDPAIEAHIAACLGEEDERGWMVRKRRQSKPIDAVIAMSLAVWRAQQSTGPAGVWFPDDDELAEIYS